MTFEEAAERDGIKLLDWQSVAELQDIFAKFQPLFANKIAGGRRDGQPMTLNLHVVDLPGFNAFASSFGGTDQIGIYRDVVPWLRAISRAIISQGHLLRHIGSSALQPDQYTSSITRGDALAYHPVWRVPPLADPEREELAGHILELGLLFIFAHEFAHIYNGHCEYAGAHFGLAIISERDLPNRHTPTGAEDETLEFDADCAGMQSVIEIALQPKVTVVEHKAAWDLPEQGRYGSRNDTIQLVIIAVSICTMLFAAQDVSDPADTRPRGHPHPLFRMQSLQGYMLDLLSFRTGKSRDAVEGPVMEAVPRLMASWVGVFSREFFLYTDINMIGPPFEARQNLWRRTWAGMRDELDSNKRGGRLAPVVQGRHPTFLTT